MGHHQNNEVDIFLTPDDESHKLTQGVESLSANKKVEAVIGDEKTTTTMTSDDENSTSISDNKSNNNIQQDLARGNSETNLNLQVSIDAGNYNEFDLSTNNNDAYLTQKSSQEEQNEITQKSNGDCDEDGGDAKKDETNIYDETTETECVQSELNGVREEENPTNGNTGNENGNEKQKLNNLVTNDLKYVFKFTRYFLIKSNNYENVNLAKLKGVWSTPRVNEVKLNKAYKECANVILVFSVSESSRFQGYARLSSECRSDPDLKVNWILPPNLSAKSLMGVFKIDWITKYLPL